MGYKIGIYYDNPPYSVIVNGTRQSGIVFDILEILKNKLNFSYNAVPISKQVVGFQLDQYFVDKKIDVMAAFNRIPIGSHYGNYLSDPSVLLYKESWNLLAPVSRTNTSLFSIFKSSLWVIIILTSFLFGYLLFFTNKLRNNNRYGRRDHAKVPHEIFHSMYFVYGSLLRQSVAMLLNSSVIRVLCSTWWIFGLFLSAYYVANLISFLTICQNQSHLIDFSNFNKTGVKWMTREYNGITKMEIRNLNLKATVVVFNSDFEPSDDVYYFDEGRTLNYFLNSKKGLWCKMRPLPIDNVFRANRAFLYRKDFNLKDEFDDILSKLRKHGILHQLFKRRSFGISYCHRCFAQVENYKLKFSDYTEVCTVFIIGILLSFFVFLYEAL